ncbi:hypothetical protein [Limnoglobus roseus]|uniref:DUF433 domain-containing protein n=1 Tax=Limnoglobus roseus TaxID=2598579 RepID=A0A5C1A7Z0_9BACT|nr:hypothetical protein [Limnoglobus roseus]QEL13288.1 hypothetical protein PX52LOC_00142 [Limnoglobus roseus]
MNTQLGLGIYDLREAARFTRLNPTRVRRWFVQRPSEPNRKPVLHSDYSAIQGDPAISFLDLIDVFVFGQLRTHGVSLPTLRKVSVQLTKVLDTRHPFAHHRLATDGQEVFLRGIDADGKDELIEVLTRQRVFPEIIAPFLKKLDYDPSTDLARLWHIGRGVILDPRIAMGKPVVEGVYVKTDLLAAAWEANKRNAEAVARWYNVGPQDVLRAVEFELGQAA